MFISQLAGGLLLGLGGTGADAAVPTGPLETLELAWPLGLLLVAGACAYAAFRYAAAVRLPTVDFPPAVDLGPPRPASAVEPPPAPPESTAAAPPERAGAEAVAAPPEADAPSPNVAAQSSPLGDDVRARLEAAEEQVRWFERLLREMQHLAYLCMHGDDDAEDCHALIAGAAERLFPAWGGHLECAAAGDASPACLAAWPEPALPQWAEPASTGAPAAWPASSSAASAAASPTPATAPPDPPADASASVPARQSLRAPFADFLLRRTVVLELHGTRALDALEMAAARRCLDAFAEALQLLSLNTQARVALRDQALRDGLTGLYNRRHFDAALQREINRAMRGAHGLTVALIDIDHFKSFNDAFGHEAGDAVLKAVAARVMSFVRSYDVACRIGGEEIALLLPDAGLEEAGVRLEELREAIAAMQLVYDGASLPAVTVSIGIADARPTGRASGLRCADAALYAAKRGGRNRVAQWDCRAEPASSFGTLGEPALQSGGTAGTAA